MYDRKIIYLHRYEGKVDKGNAGYIKQENKNGICTFMVSLMNMPESYMAETNLVVFPMDFTICKVNIKDGKGQGMAVFEESYLKDRNVVLSDISCYYIGISSETEIKSDNAISEAPSNNEIFFKIKTCSNSIKLITIIF